MVVLVSRDQHIARGEGGGGGGGGAASVKGRSEKSGVRGEECGVGGERWW